MLIYQKTVRKFCFWCEIRLYNKFLMFFMSLEIVFLFTFKNSPHLYGQEELNEFIAKIN